MLGYDPDEFEQNINSWKALVHPDDLETVSREMGEHIVKGEPFSITYRARSSQGEWQWVLARGRVLEWGPDGSATRMVGTHVDIHEQTMLIEKIGEQNEELMVLYKLSMSVSRSASLQETVDVILDLLKETFKCDLAVLYLLEGNEIVFRGVRNDTKAPEYHFDKRGLMEESLCGQAVKQQKALFSKDLSKEANSVQTSSQTTGIRSFAALPLVSGTTVVGVIGVGAIRLTDYEMRQAFLCSVASVAASGVANALLHEKLRKHSEEMESLVQERTRELYKLDNAMEHVSLSIIITDAKGFIEYVNPFFTELTGYSKEEVLGKNPRMFKSGMHDRSFYKEMWSQLLKKQTWRGELCNRKKGGATYWERASISPLTDDSGVLNHFIAVKEDTTQRRQYEQELLILSKAIRNAASSVIVTDVSGHIVYVNPSFMELTGYTFEDVAGKNPRILKSGLHDKQFYQDLWKTISGGKPWKGEFLNRRKDGTRFWMAARISPVFDKHGVITQYVGVQNDVTEKKELEHLKDDVDRIMRHDLKTPLNGLIGFPELIEMEGNLTEDQLELTRAIAHSARKMLRMIDLSLDFFKMETGRYEYMPRRVDLIACLRELSTDFHSKLSAKQLILRITLGGLPVSGGESFLVYSEESLLYTLLSNLLTNAIEASPAGGEVSVTLDVECGCLVSIRNIGAVPLPVRKTFFRKYHTYGKKSGTGLGAYSAMMVAEAMGYTIRMETSSEENQTILFIEIPEASCLGSE